MFPLEKQLGSLNFSDKLSYYRSKIMHKNRHGKLPASFPGMFTLPWNNNDRWHAIQTLFCFQAVSLNMFCTCPLCRPFNKKNVEKMKSRLPFKLKVLQGCMLIDKQSDLSSVCCHCVVCSLKLKSYLLKKR